MPAWRRCGANLRDRTAACRRANARQNSRPKRKTRPGGQPDGSSHMGAWGGWALAPNTASMGRDYRSHIYWSRKGRHTFKRSGDFFNFLAGIFRSVFKRKRVPGRDPGRVPVRVRKTRQIKNPEPSFDLSKRKRLQAGTYCAAGRLPSPTADLSEAMAAGGWFNARVAGTSCRSEALFSAAGVSETATTGTADAVAAAETAA